MSKKATGKASAAKPRKKTTVDYSPATTVKTLEKRLALMGYVRGKDWSTELIEELQKTERELASCSDLLKTLPATASEEPEVMERLRELEVRRFQLLGEVHGNRVNDYHVLIS